MISKEDYKIKKVREGIFMVEVQDAYKLAMLFLRAQEYYESPNKNFRGNKYFSIWEYIEWYSKQNGNSFTYARDWTGFNVPLNVALDLYERVYDVPTPYDTVMKEILTEIQKMNEGGVLGYIIGISKGDNATYKHEICHGLYHINREYRNGVNKITRSIGPRTYKILCNNLKEMGYTEQVFEDEVQAYLTEGTYQYNFMCGVSETTINKLSKQYNVIYEKYYNKK